MNNRFYELICNITKNTIHTCVPGCYFMQNLKTALALWLVLFRGEAFCFSSTGLNGLRGYRFIGNNRIIQ